MFGTQLRLESFQNRSTDRSSSNVDGEYGVAEKQNAATDALAGVLVSDPQTCEFQIQLA
jgi:hypothetical protein